MEATEQQATTTPEMPEFATQAEYRAYKERGYQPEEPKPEEEAEEERPSTEESEEETKESEPEPEAGKDNTQEAAPADDKVAKSNRYRELVAQRKAAEERERAQEERNAALEARIREYEARTGQPAQQKAPERQEEAEKPLVRPKLSDYDFDEDRHAAALDEFDAEKERRKESKAAKEREAAQQQEARSAFERQRDARLEQGRKKYADFTDVVEKRAGSDLPISPLMAEIMVHMDEGADVAYYLGKNPNEAKRIVALPPYLVALELGKLTSKAVPPEKQKQPQPDFKPPSRVGSNTGASPRDISEARSQREYRELRKRQFS